MLSVQLSKDKNKVFCELKNEHEFPHGPQKIEILNKLDPLYLKSPKKISPQKVEKWQIYGL